MVALIATIISIIIGLAAGPAFAVGECEGCAPWWHVTAGTRPTYLPAGTAKNEVQELVTGAVSQFRFRVDGSSGIAGESLGLSGNPTYFATEPLAATENTNPLTAVNLQSALEEPMQYGPGAVKVEEVTEGADGKPLENGDKRFLISGIAPGPMKPINIFETEDEPSTTKVVTEGKSSGVINIVAANLGDAPVNAEANPVTITDELPVGFTAVQYESATIETEAEAPGQVKCQLGSLSDPRTVTCTFGGPGKEIRPYGKIELRIGAIVAPGASGGQESAVSVSGGGAVHPATVMRPLAIAKVPGEQAPFGVENFEVTPEEPNGLPDRQAGSHPFQTTFSIGFNQGPQFTGLSGEPEDEPTGGSIKDVRPSLPPGLIGNPSPFTRCTLPQFQAEACPASSVIGVATLVGTEPAVIGLKTNLSSPLFNLEPSVGEPARFGFLPTKETPVFLDAQVRSGEDYGVTVETNNIVQVLGTLSAQVTVWGVPGDSRHDISRGFACLKPAFKLPCNSLEATNPPPFFVMPTSCPAHPLETGLETDSWKAPGQFVSVSTSQFATMPTLVGCDRLPFEPSITVSPDGKAGSTPTGLTVDVHVPQKAVLNAHSLAQAAVKTITVALPAGVAIDASGAGGLESCSEGLVGFKGFAEFNLSSEPGVSRPAFSPKLPGSNGSSERFEPGINFCPDASKIGEVTIRSPLLPANQPVKGFVYLADQESNPFGSLIAMYIIAEDPISGFVAKLPGHAELCRSPGEVIFGQTCAALGQIVTTFEDSPQLAFEDAELHFFGGERAPLATPERCGSYTAEASFVPWSAEPSDEAALIVHSSATFDITTGPGGTSCPGASLPFTPSLTAQTTSNQAGGFSPFTVTMSRADGEQHLQAIGLKMPPGVLGLLAGVELCPEPQADLGECGPASLIGETTVSVGVGGQPFSVRGGRVYLTGPYKGAPFGLSIVNPAKAGPFDLANTKTSKPPCDCVLVRAKVEVDPLTAALTVTSDNEGPYKIPTSLEGIPLQIQHVNVTVNRQGFMFNPTNCERLGIQGVLAASEGATQTINVPFQATNCAALKFAPKVSVATAGKTSKVNGSSLLFKIAYPKGAMGSQSWFNEAKFVLPKQLPARLTTIQKACVASVFESNPAMCPSASLIGHATVHTPVLPVPLSGPVYFVSHGGLAFPDAVIVLQGDGVTVDLVGETHIDGKTGVTSATFRNTPDVPFENIEVTIPAGPFSEFGANLPASAHASFCGQKLIMPTLFKAQNGLEIHQNTAVGVTGCPKAKGRAQLYTAALKACRKKHNKHKRQACERAARQKYGPVKKKKS